MSVLFPEKLGANLALLNCFNVIGQQVSNFGIGMGVAQAWPNKPGNLIGISCIFAFAGAISSFWITIPDQQFISDNDDLENSESGSDQPASL